MVEKLCSRLKESRTDAVAQKCAYCLTLLTHSEKTIRRLIEHMKDFKGKFQIPEVHGSFNQVIAKANKASANTQMKAVMDELTAKVEECLRINEDGEEMPQTQPSTQSSQAPGKGKGRGRAKKKPRRSYSDESENEENAKPARGRGRRAAKNVSDSE